MDGHLPPQDPGPDPEGGQPPWRRAPSEDDELLGFAHRMFDLARAGSPELVAYVDAGVPVELTDPDGNTLLMLAAYHGHAPLVRGLVERGADPGRRNDRGQTPVAGAVFKGEVAVVEVLMRAGADPAAGVPNALDTAHMFEREDLLSLLTRPPGPA